MSKRNILKFILAVSSVLFILPVYAQNDPVLEEGRKTTQPEVRGIQFSKETIDNVLEKKSVPFFSGVSVSGDLAGLFMAAFTSYGQIEGAIRLNFKETYLPIFEMGWGICDDTNEVTSIHYKTNAPFFRIGCDYNFLKNKKSGNRLYAGLRYAFTTFNYDLERPLLQDPHWGHYVPFEYKGINSNCQWAEIVFGLETKIWSIFHLGWSIRYKLRLSEKKHEIGEAWYIPGFGKNGSNMLGGTFNLIFDI